MKLPTFLGVAAALAVGAAVSSLIVEFGPMEAVSNEPSPTRVTPPKAAEAVVLDNTDLTSRSLGPARTDPFFPVPEPVPLPVTVAAPPVPVATPVASAPLPAPPFPFEFVGRMVGPSGQPVVFLASGERLLTVHAKGDLGGGYQVDELTDVRMVITHVASEQISVIEFAPDVHGPSNASTNVEVALTAPHNAKIGDTFEVPVQVKSDLSLRGLPIQVAYDRTRLKLLDWGQGPFLRRGGVTTSVTRTADAAPGSIDIGILRNTPDGATGAGVLATLKFKAVAKGDAQVRLTRINPLGIDRIVEAPALPPPVFVSIQ